MVAYVLYLRMIVGFPSWTREFESRLPLHFFNNLQRYTSGLELCKMEWED